MSSASHYFALGRRAILHTARQPTAVVPSILFPLVFLAMTSSALDRSTSLPGFPEVDSFMQFAISATVIQGVLFGAVAAGTDMAKDIEDGFFERLIASPIARTPIVVGRIAGAALLGFIQALIFLTIGTIFGLNIEGGIVAMLLVATTASVLGAGIGSVTVAMGLRTGSSEAVQGSFPLIFVLLFLSSAFFPRDLMSGWFKAVATANPMSHLVEGIRYQIITGIDIGEWGVSIGIATAVFAVGVGAALLALNGRVKATHG